MNKRLRRKKHVGEFQELGFELNCKVDLKPDDPEFDNWCDDFIAMIESHELICGGGGLPSEWGVFVSRHKGSVTEKERCAISDWLKENKHVMEFEVKDLEDAWNTKTKTE